MIAVCRLFPALILRITVSVTFANPLVDPERVRDCLSQICASQGEFERFFSEVFDQLDDLSGQLLRRQQAWQREKAEAEEAFRRRAAQFEAERAAMAAEQSHGAVVTAADEHLHKVLESIEQERSALRAALEETQRRAGELSQVAADLAAAREDILHARTFAEAAAGQADQALQEKISELQRDRDGLQQERILLEAELEAIRNRAAEMAETLAQQKREIGEERSQWAEELKRLRRLMESFASRPAEPERIVEQRPAPQASAPAAAKNSSESDPVLESVMAQFEMLQKDLARRRKQPSCSG